MAAASSAAFLAPALPMANVPTGMPPGICTVASRASRPWRGELSMGTPSTDSRVCAAVTPARCAAPPAPQMITSMPRASAVSVNASRRSGVRWAEMTRTSLSMPRRDRVSDAGRITAASGVTPPRVQTASASSTSNAPENRRSGFTAYPARARLASSVS